jgi:putative peptidoglycan lipid II flippase
LVAAPWGIDALLIGFVAGMGLQVAVLLPSFWHRARGHLRFAPRADDLRDLAARYLPVFITHALLQAFLLLDRSFSTLADPAGAAQFEYAERVVNASRAVLGGSLAIVLFPRLTHLRAVGDAAEALVARALGLVCVVTLPVVLTFVFFGDVPVTLAFEHGRFDAEDARAVTAALRGLGPAVLFYGLLYVADRIFIARGRVWTYAGIVAAGLLADAWVKVTSVDELGLLGVGLGTAVGTLIIAVVATAVLVRGGAPGSLRPAWLDLRAAVLAFGSCFGTAAWGAAHWGLGPWGRFGALGAAWVLGAAALALLGPPAWVMLREKIRR